MNYSHANYLRNTFVDHGIASLKKATLSFKSSLGTSSRLECINFPLPRMDINIAREAAPCYTGAPESQILSVSAPQFYVIRPLFDVMFRGHAFLHTYRRGGYCCHGFRATVFMAGGLLLRDGGSCLQGRCCNHSKPDAFIIPLSDPSFRWTHRPLTAILLLKSIWHTSSHFHNDVLAKSMPSCCCVTMHLHLCRLTYQGQGSLEHSQLLALPQDGEELFNFDVEVHHAMLLTRGAWHSLAISCDRGELRPVPLYGHRQKGKNFEKVWTPKMGRNRQP